jgi:hypothetical protein
MKSGPSKLHNFVHAFGAARVLIQKANKEGALLEGMALYASMSDAFLRISLVLKRQTVEDNSDIDDSLISQEKNGKHYTERQIQRMAINERVITQEIFDELGALYDKRNDAIHKFFLTDLQYADLPPTLARYEIIYNKLKGIVYDLEAEQIKKGTGMSALDKGSKESTLKLLQDVAMKIDPNMATETTQSTKSNSE